MDVLLALAVVGFIAWWIRYNQLYNAGAVKVPFFSLGTQPKARRVKVSSRPVSRARATPPASAAAQREIGQAVSKITRYTHNAEVSVRLLHSTRQANMSRSIDWCADKVVDDILRDRR
ncbi:MAG TPA: hypothetical protein VLO13_05605 [Halomonas sp.]|nr:hypothetical protein [Halomonas sp.]